MRRRHPRAGQRWVGVATVLGLVGAWGDGVGAHATRSVSVDIVEVSPGTALVHLRRQVPADSIDLSVSEPCRFEPLDGAPTADPVQKSLRVRCPDGVSGMSLQLSGLGPVVTEAVVLYTLVDGRSGSAVVRASDAVFRVPTVTSKLDVARGYLASGVSHILEGYDHLLFLLLLVLNLRTVGSVLVAETAFTVSHSISFSATALGWIHVSPPAAEACIALSLVLMALDIRAGVPGPRRRGAMLAFVFGLVHGLGFAGALTELGVPDRDVAVALVGFAGGVELGQVMFLAGVLALLNLLAHADGIVRRFEPVAVSAIGGLSTFWLFERVASVLAART